MPRQTTPEFDRCIKDCLECGDICVRCATHCLGMGGDHAAPEHQTLLHDCADICQSAARFMGRSSPHHTHLCRECAEICTQCADDCERMAEGDATMTKCAGVCRRCAQSCQQMAGAGV